MMTYYCVRQVGLEVKPLTGMVELKMENRYLQALTSTDIGAGDYTETRKMILK